MDAGVDFLLLQQLLGSAWVVGDEEGLVGWVVILPAAYGRTICLGSVGSWEAFNAE